ncbi:hypothetical protein D3C71_1570780 [compost metagenome]
MAVLLGQQLYTDPAKTPVPGADRPLQLLLDQATIVWVEHAAADEVGHAVFKDGTTELAEAVELLGDQGLAGVHQYLEVADDAGLVLGQRAGALHGRLGRLVRTVVQQSVEQRGQQAGLVTHVSYLYTPACQPRAPCGSSATSRSEAVSSSSW